MGSSRFTIVLLGIIAMLMVRCSEESPFGFKDGQKEETLQSSEVPENDGERELYKNTAGDCGGVILWNKLGSPSEVENSEVGPSMELGRSPGFVSGQFGNAVNFTHYSQYVTVDLWEPHEKYWGEDEFTFEFWCRINRWGWLGYMFDFINHRGVKYGFLRLVLDYTNSGILRFAGAYESDDYTVPLPHGYDFGVWHHYAIVVSTTHVQMYYDGQLLLSAPLREIVLHTAMPNQLDIGSEWQHNHTDFHFFGTMDNWVVYDYAKTDFSDRFVEMPFMDTDCDGVADIWDDCPESNLEGTIVIAGTDSGVENHLFNSGCTMVDMIEACAAGSNNHGGFVRRVSHLTNQWKKSGLISGQEKGAIMKCVAASNTP